MKTARPYQLSGIQECRDEIAAGKKAILIQAQTGAGKTVVGSIIIKSCYDKGKRCLVLAHSRILVNQWSEELTDAGVPHCVLMAGVERNLEYQVTVASRDTLLSRAVRRRRLVLPPADLIIIDEAHRGTGNGYKKLLALYPEAIKLGPTATPAKISGRPVTEVWQGLVQISQPSQLIAEGFLVPTRVFAPFRPDTRGLKRRGADFDPDEAAKLMDKPKLVGDVIEHWKRLASDRPTVCFACNIAHSLHLVESFAAAGIKAEHIDKDTDGDTRMAIFGRVASGETKVICNCMVLTEGWNLPVVSCAILACPTRSFVKFRQCAGRIQRPWPGKADAILLDHSGAVFAFGFPDDDFDWKAMMVSGANVNKLAKNQANPPGMPGEPTEAKMMQCPKCFAMYRGSPRCPQCGHVTQRKGRSLNTEGGQLREVAGGQPTVATIEDKQRYWHVCLATTANRGQQLRVAAGMFSRRFAQPPWQCVGLVPMPQYEQWKEFTGTLYPKYVRGRR